MTLLGVVVAIVVVFAGGFGIVETGGWLKVIAPI